MINRLLRREPETEEEKVKELLSKEPEGIDWVTVPKTRWVVAYNPYTRDVTADGIFSSDMAVYNYPVGITYMSVPKLFLASPFMMQLFYLLDWPGGDLRPPRRIRSLRIPGLIEVVI